MSARGRSAVCLVWCVWLVAVMSCRRRDEQVTRDEVVPAPADASPPDAVVPRTIDGLKFEDDVTRPRLLQLEGCAEEVAKGGGRTIPWHEYGNFLGAKWCRGKGARDDCQIAGANEHDRDQHVITLETLHYPGGTSPYFGLSLDALWVPAGAGWGALFSFGEKGQTIIGDSFGFTFRRYATATDTEPEEVVLRGGYYYVLFEEDVTVGPSKLPLRAELQRYLGSPEALRDAGLDFLSQARAEVTSILATHKAKVRVWGVSPRPGLPPPYTMRPPTAAEEASELAKAKAHFDAKDALVSGHYKEMYETLLRAFPLDRCWK